MDAAQVPVTDDDDLPGDPPADPPAGARKPEGARTPPAAGPAKPRAEPEPAKPRRSKALLDALAEFGYGEADVEGMTNEEVWADLHELRKARPPQPAAAAATPGPKPEPKDPDEEYLAELEKVDPNLARLIRRAAKGQDNSPVEELKKELAELKQAEAERRRHAFDRALDGAFAALDEKFLPLVGEGPIGELTDPGQRGWRGAIFHAAKVTAKDGRRAIAEKVAAAAEQVAGARVKAAPAPSAYEDAARRPPRKVPPKDPVNGRFTAEDFEAGHLHRPNGRRPGPDKTNAVEQVTSYFKEIGDPRGDRPAIDFGDDDLPE